MVAVSIIMPSFNSARFLDEAVQSVVDQSFKNWELLICDDGSSDSSIQIARKWSERDSRIFSLRNKMRKGVVGTRNTCLSKAQGRYIAFLDSDDVWLPKKIELQLRFMRDTNSPFVFGYCENMSEKGEFLSITKAPATVSLRKLFFSNFIPCLTVVYDTEMLGKVEQPNIEKRNDYALWLCVLGANRDVEARCFPEVVARYRINSYGLSANKLVAIKYFYKCLRQFANLGRVTASLFTLSAIALKAIKTGSPRVYNIVLSIFF